MFFLYENLFFVFVGKLVCENEKNIFLLLLEFSWVDFCFLFFGIDFRFRPLFKRHATSAKQPPEQPNPTVTSPHSIRLPTSWWKVPASLLLLMSNSKLLMSGSKLLMASSKLLMSFKVIVVKFKVADVKFEETVINNKEQADFGVVSHNQKNRVLWFVGGTLVNLTISFMWMWWKRLTKLKECGVINQQIRDLVAARKQEMWFCSWCSWEQYFRLLMNKHV